MPLKTSFAALFFFLLSCSISQGQNPLQPLPDFPGEGRTQSVSFEINGKIYVGLGQGSTGSYADFWEYDPATLNWTQKASFPGGARISAASLVINGNAYVGLGGTQVKLGPFGTAVGSKDWWEYNPALNTWSQKANFPGAAMFYPFSFVINAKGYLGSGIREDGQLTKELWSYDPVANAWTQKADFPGFARFASVAFAIDNSGYVGTGYTFDVLATNDFWAYDAAQNTWQAKPDFSGSKRESAFGFSMNSRGYLGGGRNGSDNMSDLWEYDPGSGIWTKVTDLPAARYGWAGAGASGNIYFGLGGSGSPVTYPKSFWEYSISSLDVVSVPRVLCAGSSFQLNYASQTNFDPDNIIQVQLSDKQGNFTQALVVGSKATAENSGVITFALPDDLEPSSNYRIRLASSNESFTGAIYGQALIINPKNISPEISRNVTGTVCAGTEIDFSLANTGDLTGTSFQWEKNSQVVGTNSTTYAELQPAQGDVIRCKVLRDPACVAQPAVYSNALTLDVNPIVIPSITIASGAGDRVCAQSEVTYTATVQNGGASPEFIWKKNGAALTQNGSTLTIGSLSDKDEISCTLVSNAVCRQKESAESNVVKMTILPLPARPTISVSGNVLRSSYTSGKHQWFLEDVPLEGETNPTLLMEASGVYKVRYDSDCSSLSDPYIGIFTGVSETWIRDQVYPNPFTKAVMIPSLGSAGDRTIVVSDARGHQVHSAYMKEKETEIDLSFLADGMYILSIASETGLHFYKVIKRQ